MIVLTSWRASLMVVGFAGLCVACSDARRGEGVATKGTTSPATPAAQAAGACFEAPGLESAATRCGQGAVSQVGDTLVIRLADTGFVKRVNNPEDGDAHAAFRYLGRMGGTGGSAALHVVERHGWEEGSVELINARTGAVALVRDRPIMSPDGSRFAVVVDQGMNTWDRVTSCFGPSEVTVWRMTDSIPVKEFGVDAFDCNTGHGWGPSAPVWQSADTLVFTRKNFLADSAARAKGVVDSARATLAHVASGWVLDGGSTALLPVR